MRGYGFWFLNWRFFLNAWHFLAKNKDLFWLPVAGICSVALLAIMLVVLEGYWVINHAALAWIVISGLIGLLLSAFVVSYFQAALLCCVAQRLQNKPGSLADGLGVAAQQWLALLCWTVIRYTVGTLLHALESSHDILADIVVSIVGVAWSIASFFTLPFIVFERQGSIAALRSSIKLCKAIWQGRMRSRVRVASLFFLLACILLIFIGYIASLILGIAIIKIYFINHLLASSIFIIALLTVLSLMGLAFHAVVSASLFLFYTKPELDTTVMPYHADLLAQAFQPRRGSIVK